MESHRRALCGKHYLSVSPTVTLLPIAHSFFTGQAWNTSGNKLPRKVPFKTLYHLRQKGFPQSVIPFSAFARHHRKAFSRYPPISFCYPSQDILPACYSVHYGPSRTCSLFVLQQTKPFSHLQKSTPRCEHHLSEILYCDLQCIRPTLLKLFPVHFYGAIYHHVIIRQLFPSIITSLLSSSSEGLYHDPRIISPLRGGIYDVLLVYELLAYIPLSTCATHRKRISACSKTHLFYVFPIGQIP